MPRLQVRSLERPDDARTFAKGEGSLVRVGPLSVGRARLQPGWRWSVDVKPMTGTEWCEIHHLNVVLSGRLGVSMDDGETGELVAGDVVEIPPGHDAWVLGDEPAVLLDIFGNAADFALPISVERAVATLLMTDIVGSTARAERLGDAAWKQLLANHNRVVRSQLQRFHGREVSTTGDGFLATFASAVGAVRCAAAASDAVRELGLEVRVAVHTGEIEVLPDDVRGIAVHATARMMALAGPSEVIVSATTRALAEGSGLRFEARGRHQLKGFESPVELFALAV